jgi:transcriptional regulator GlxA family with amidase domain
MSIDHLSVKKVVSEQLQRIETFSDLARLLGSSPDVLRKEFERREGITLWTYVEGVRLERAKKLLIESNLECKEICLEIGFTREEFESRFFKRATGLSMTEFRRKGRFFNSSIPIFRNAQIRRNKSLDYSGQILTTAN